MFPKGPRFPAAKVSQVPGPNAYNPQDPEFDAYKHGAFLEKTSRFLKENVPDAPGPGAYDADPAVKNPRSTSRTGKPTSDRSAALQRKIEDLERINLEGRKSFHLEMERLKLELSRAQRSAAEHAERADRLKKQNDALDARVQELKKAGASDQSDLRELRMRLRAVEHERAQLSAKQSEAGGARQALQAAEARRKDEVRERDRKLAELGKALGAEQKKHELAEARLAEIRSKGDVELQEIRSAASDLDAQLRDAHVAAHEAKKAFADFQKRAGDKQDELLEKLEQYRTLMAHVATEYGRLASATVPLALHTRIKEESTALQLRVLRLERKLANTEGQVVELANLVRYTKDDNKFLSARLREAETEGAFYAQALHGVIHEERTDPSAYRDLDVSLLAVGREIRESQAAVHQVLVADISLWTEFYRLRNDALVLHCTALIKGLDGAEQQLEQSATELSQSEAKRAELEASLESMQAEHVDMHRQLSQTLANLQISQAAEANVRKQLEDARTRAQAEVLKVEQALRTQKEANHRLAGTVQKCKAAEDALQAEAEQIAAELAQAERYQDAYHSLLEEVDALVSRNALAEEEAKRISRFNAEILGHNNPNQRIEYVDRIRRELYEAKQKLLVSIRDRDAALANSEDLRHELELYKSVAVPPEFKPRTIVTRVGRVPLAAQSVNVSTSTRPNESTFTKSLDGSAKKLEPMPEVEYEHGDMTVEELM